MRRTPSQRARIAALNDQARRNFFFFSEVYETLGFGAIPFEDRQRARLAIEQYDAFEKDGDTSAEHDSGTVYLLSDGTWQAGAHFRSDALIIVCWRFDYFDQKRVRQSEAPWDSEITRRKLTIGLEEEFIN
jgi:hypothetical protein